MERNWDLGISAETVLLFDRLFQLKRALRNFGKFYLGRIYRSWHPTFLLSRESSWMCPKRQYRLWFLFQSWHRVFGHVGGPPILRDCCEEGYRDISGPKVRIVFSLLFWQCVGRGSHNRLWLKRYHRISFRVPGPIRLSDYFYSREVHGNNPNIFSRKSSTSCWWYGMNGLSFL